MNDSAFCPVAQRPSRPSPSRSAPGSPTRRGDAAIIATDMLNRALAVTRVMALRCEREYHTALRLHSPPLAGAALEHANDAGSHAHRIRERMRELGGEINQAAEVALPSQRTAREADNPLAAVIADDLSAARAALDGYREIAAFFATVRSADVRAARPGHPGRKRARRRSRRASRPGVRPAGALTRAARRRPRPASRFARRGSWARALALRRSRHRRRQRRAALAFPRVEPSLELPLGMPPPVEVESFVDDAAQRQRAEAQPDAEA